MSKQGIMIEWINNRNNKTINSKSVNSILIKALGLNVILSFVYTLNLIQYHLF